ncbi:MAG: hypothetical protein ACXV1K_00195 [Kineosporiaceae bacterium]
MSGGDGGTGVVPGPAGSQDLLLGPAPAVAAPSREDPVARATSAVAGGPAGRRLAPSAGFWSAATVLVLLAGAVVGVGLVQKQHCRAAGWSTPDMFWHECYTDIPVLYSSAHLGGAGALGPLEAVRSPDLGEPPLAALAMWAVASVVGDGPQAQAARAFFDLSAVVLAAVLAIAVALVVAAAGRRRSWDAAHLALAPVLVTAGLLSYELLGVALVAAALLAWSRSRPLLAGVLLGAASCATPAVAIVALALLAVAVRAGRTRPAIVAATVAGAVWLGVRILAYPGFTGELGPAWQGWKTAAPGYGSLWLVPSLLEQSRPPRFTVWFPGQALSGSAATAGVLLGLVAVVVATAALALATRRRPRLAHVALFTMATTLIVLKSLPVQASLLLLPFVALAGLRWRDHLIWATTELAYFIGVWLYIAGASAANRGLPAGFYLILLLARLAGIGWLALQATRAAVDPALDRVRTPLDGAEGEDDPMGGPVRDAEDRLVIELT